MAYKYDYKKEKRVNLLTEMRRKDLSTANKIFRLGIFTILMYVAIVTFFTAYLFMMHTFLDVLAFAEEYSIEVSARAAFGYFVGITYMMLLLMNTVFDKINSHYNWIIRKLDRR